MYQWTKSWLSIELGQTTCKQFKCNNWWNAIITHLHFKIQWPIYTVAHIWYMHGVSIARRFCIWCPRRPGSSWVRSPPSSDLPLPPPHETCTNIIWQFDWNLWFYIQVLNKYSILQKCGIILLFYKWREKQLLSSLFSAVVDIRRANLADVRHGSILKFLVRYVRHESLPACNTLMPVLLPLLLLVLFRWYTNNINTLISNS